MKGLLISDFGLLIETRVARLPISNKQSSFSNGVLMVVNRDITVINERGLHARPAMQFVDVANGFQSQVTVSRDGPEVIEVDGKSVMQMITLEATQGTVLHLKVEGDDAEQAVGKLVELFESKFGEE